MSSKKLTLLGYIFLLIVVGRLGWMAYTDNLVFESDITALLPTTEDSPLAKKAYDQVSSELNNRIIILIQGKDLTQTDAATDYFSELFDQGVAQRKISARESTGFDFKLISERMSAMYGHRESLLADSSIRGMQGSPDSQLEGRMNKVINFPPENITDPLEDPLGTLEEFLLERMPAFRGLSFDGLYLRVDSDVAANLIAIELTEGSLDNAQTTQSIEWINQVKNAVIQQFDVEIYRSGVAFHAAVIKKQTIEEVRWMTLLIIALTLGIFLYVTRSVRALSVSIASIGLAIAGGLVFSHATVGLPHLIGLTMAITAIGICIDFSLHFWIHVRSGLGGMEAVQSIRPEITLSFLTTAVSLLIVSVVSVPVLSRPAIFILGAVLVSWATLLFITPRLARQDSALNPATISNIVLPKRLLITLALFVAVVSLVGLTLKYYADDNPIKLGYRVDHLIEDDLTIKKALNVATETGIYLVQADSPDALLEIEATLLENLDPAERSKVTAVSRLVPPQSHQRRNQLLFDRFAEHISPSLLAQYSNALGVPSVNWRADNEEKYTLEWVMMQPWASIERGNLLSCSASLCASIIRVWDSAVKQMDAACEGHGNCSRISFLERHTAAFEGLRLSLGSALLLAFGSIFCILYIRYRKKAFQLVIIPLLASVSGLAAVAWAGMPVTAFTLAAIFPLLGLSVDYVIFACESGKRSAPTFLAISASALTTALSFLILSFSSTPAIQYFALPIAVGIFVAWSTVQLVRPLNA